MKRKFLFFTGAVALAIALLAMGGRPVSTVHADPFTTEFDITISDAPPEGGTTGGGVCDTNDDDTIDSGECPVVSTNVVIDTRTEPVPALQESFFDQATTFWSVDALQSTGAGGVDLDGDTSIEDAEKNALYPTNGLGATPGGAINEGAKMGEITFAIKSNALKAAANNICLTAGGVCSTSVGQPPPISASQSGPPAGGQLGPTTFPIHNGELGTAPADLVSQADEDDNGLTDTVQDEVLSDGSAGKNGIRDGVDLQPEPMVEYYAELALPNAALVSRAFGVAELLVIFGNVATNDVNFVVFSGEALGSDGYFSFSIVGYPWVAAEDPDPLTGSKMLTQAVDTAPPFLVTVNQYGITQTNTAELDEDFDDIVDTDGTDIAGGEISRKMYGTGGPYVYKTDFSSTEDYDNDGLAQVYDYCDLANFGTLTYAGQQTADSDGDNMIGICDINGEGTNPADGTEGTHSDCPDDDADGECDTGFGGWNDVLSKGQDFDQDDPPGDWNGDGCAGICGVDDDGDTAVDELTGGATVADDDEDGVDDEGNWVGDGSINAQDNCPQLPDIDIDNADADDDPTTGIDFQLDTDGDGVGDLCDKAPGIQGDGSDTSSFDNDNDCGDEFSIDASEPEDDGACKNTTPHGNTDADDDSESDLFDWDNDGTYDDGEADVDSNTDNPSQGPPDVLPYTTDTGDYASDACEVYVGTNPKSADDDPVGNTYRTFTVGGDATDMDCDGDTTADENDSTPFPGQADTDGDGCTDWEENGPAKNKGGLRDDSNFYDFFDVPAPPIHTVGAAASKNKVVFGEDLSAILVYGGVTDPSPGVNNPIGSGDPNGNGAVYDDDNNNNGIEDGLEYDLEGAGPPPGAGPNGTVFGEELSQVLLQGGDDCTAAP